MKKIAVIGASCLLLAAAPSTFAFGLGSLGGLAASATGIGSTSDNGAGVVTAASLVAKYVAGQQSILKSQSLLLGALGLKDEAEKATLAASNLTEGATQDALKDAIKTQEDGSKKLEDALAKPAQKLDENAKTEYVKGLGMLAVGMGAYALMATDIKNFKPDITSVGAEALAALYVVKSLPDSLASLKTTIKSSIDFANANKIEVPKDATALI